MTATSFAYVDLESDGLHHGRHIYEVAIVRVGGFYDRHPQGREMSGKAPLPGIGVLSRKATALKVHQLLHGAHMVGVNPTFDATTLAALLRAEGFPPEPWHYHLIDLGAMAYGWLTARGEHVEVPWRSYQLAEACGVELAPETERHTALADAQWAKRWHDTLTGLEVAEAAA